ncbi:MAG TPA: rhodanese-like domain-containing protein [Acidimicrobiales bacterium]|nr:rhodanese-like domain-containing protein [Acidimicrobiales bacterium]
MELRLTEDPRVAGGGASRIDQLVVQARSGYTRVSAAEASRIFAAGGLLVDVRPAAQRSEFGEIPGAIVIERNVLEWRLDPTSAHRHPAVSGADQDIVVVCQEGYASSLAAATLREMGLSRATDLEGGYVAWAAAGLPTIPGCPGPGCPGPGMSSASKAETDGPAPI